MHTMAKTHQATSTMTATTPATRIRKANSSPIPSPLPTSVSPASKSRSGQPSGGWRVRVRQPGPGEAHGLAPGPIRQRAERRADQLPGERHRPDPVEPQSKRPQQACLEPALDPTQPGLVASRVLGDDTSEGIVVEGQEGLEESVRLQQPRPDVKACRVQPLLNAQPRDPHHVTAVQQRLLDRR